MIGVGSGSTTAATAFAFPHSPLLIFPRGSVQSRFAAGQENPFPESIEANNFQFHRLRLFASAVPVVGGQGCVVFRSTFKLLTRDTTYISDQGIKKITKKSFGSTVLRLIRASQDDRFLRADSPSGSGPILRQDTDRWTSQGAPMFDKTSTTRQRVLVLLNPRSFLLFEIYRDPL